MDSDHELWLRAKAPDRLKHKIETYKTLIERFVATATLCPKDVADIAHTSYEHRAHCMQASRDLLVAELIQLAKTASPETVNGDNLVVFETYRGDSVEIGWIGHYLELIADIYQGDYAIVRTPKWVYAMILEATNLEKIVMARQTVSAAEFTVTEAYPAPTKENMKEAAILWEPYTEGAYKHFSDALQTVRLLT